MRTITAEIIDDFEIANERFLFIWDDSEERKLGLKVPADAELGIGDWVRLEQADAANAYTVTGVKRALRRKARSGGVTIPKRGKVESSVRTHEGAATAVGIDTMMVLRVN